MPKGGGRGSDRDSLGRFRKGKVVKERVVEGKRVKEESR